MKKGLSNFRGLNTIEAEIKEENETKPTKVCMIDLEECLNSHLEEGIQLWELKGLIFMNVKAPPVLKSLAKEEKLRTVHAYEPVCFQNERNVAPADHVALFLSAFLSNSIVYVRQTAVQFFCSACALCSTYISVATSFVSS